MINIYEYILFKSNPKLNTIKATDETIHQIVKNELDRLGHDADLNHIDVSQVTNMDSLFSCYPSDLGPRYKDLNPDISWWDVSGVTNMEHMFMWCEKFNQDISDWNVTKVENMCGMFDGCQEFNKDISGWDVSRVKDWNFMFYNCPIKEEYKPKFKH